MTRIFALAVAGTLLWIALQVAIAAWPAIQEFGIDFLVTSSWNPVNNDYGVLPAIYGTLVSSFIGLLLASTHWCRHCCFIEREFSALQGEAGTGIFSRTSGCYSQRCLRSMGDFCFSANINQFGKMAPYLFWLATNF